MSHSLITQAIKIKISPAVSGLTTQADLGVYVNDDDSQEIRWSETILVGTDSTSWTSGIIAPSGIGDITKSLDTRQGGAPEEYSGLTVAVLNNNQLIKKLKDLDISINGLRAVLHEFEGTEADSDATSQKILFTGVCAIETASTWDEKLWQIEIKNSKFQRNAFLGTIINNDAINGNYPNATDDAIGKIVPISFGKFQVLNSSPIPAKFLRVAGKQEIISNYIEPANYFSPFATIFPVIDHSVAYGTSPYLGYRIKFGTSSTGVPDLLLRGTLVGKWMRIVIGGSADGTSLVGKYRKITAYTASSTLWIDLTLDTFFEKDLSYNSTATATNQAWVQFVDIPFEYLCDTWPCGGFLDEAGSVLTSDDKKLNLYTYKSDNAYLDRKVYNTTTATDSTHSHQTLLTTSLVPIGFRKIAPYGYEADSSGTNYNSLLINVLLFKDEPSQLASFDIFPLKDRTSYYHEDLSAWGFPEWAPILNPEFPWAPVYDNAEMTTLEDYSLSDSGGTNPEFDRKETTYGYAYIQTYTESGGTNIKVVYEFDIDRDKIQIEYDSYFLGVNISTKSVNPGAGTNCQGSIKLLMRRFMGSTIETLSNANGAKLDDYDKWSAIEDLPDFYYITGYRTVDNNKNFIFDTGLSSLSYPQQYLTGHTYFPLTGISTLEQLKSIYRVGLIYENATNATTDIFIKMREMAIICEMSASISNEIYTLSSGRIFDDAWGSRKDSTALISNPVDLLEHFKRLQSGIEFGDTVEFGKQYSPSMLIRTGDSTSIEGSYDSTHLTSIKTYTPSYQILDSADAWTDSQIKNICNTYNLCTYTDSSGYECVTTLDKINPSETITFSDIIPGSIGTTQEPEVQDVYCQPVLNYQYNYGSEKFDKQLIVLNVQDSTYVASYTPGIDNTAHTLDETTPDGEFVWNQAKGLYGRYRQIEQCPAEFSDQRMIVTYTDAVKLLSMKLSWMGKSRNTLSVFYSKGKDYFAGKHLKIKLPHQTNNLSIECLIEQCKISKSNNRVDLRLVLLEDVPKAFFFE
jgi:hypothetical protein